MGPNQALPVCILLYLKTIVCCLYQPRGRIHFINAEHRNTFSLHKRFQVVLLLAPLSQRQLKVVPTTNNLGRNILFLFFHLVSNGDMKVDRNSARLPARLNHQSASYFPGSLCAQWQPK